MRLLARRSLLRRSARLQRFAQAANTAEQLAEQMQTAMRSTRAASMKAAQALAESYTAMVSGVLIGMSEALQSGAAAKKTPPRK